MHGRYVVFLSALHKDLVSIDDDSLVGVTHVVDANPACILVSDKSAAAVSDVIDLISDDDNDDYDDDNNDKDDDCIIVDARSSPSVQPSAPMESDVAEEPKAKAIDSTSKSISIDGTIKDDADSSDSELDDAFLSQLDQDINGRAPSTPKALQCTSSPVDSDHRSVPQLCANLMPAERSSVHIDCQSSHIGGNSEGGAVPRAEWRSRCRLEASDDLDIFDAAMCDELEGDSVDGEAMQAVLWPAMGNDEAEAQVAMRQDEAEKAGVGVKAEEEEAAADKVKADKEVVSATANNQAEPAKQRDETKAVAEAEAAEEEAVAKAKAEAAAEAKAEEAAAVKANAEAAAEAKAGVAAQEAKEDEDGEVAIAGEQQQEEQEEANRKSEQAEAFTKAEGDEQEQEQEQKHQQEERKEAANAKVEAKADSAANAEAEAAQEAAVTAAVAAAAVDPGIRALVEGLAAALPQP